MSFISNSIKTFYKAQSTVQDMINEAKEEIGKAKAEAEQSKTEVKETPNQEIIVEPQDIIPLEQPITVVKEERMLRDFRNQCTIENADFFIFRKPDFLTGEPEERFNNIFISANLPANVHLYDETHEIRPKFNCAYIRNPFTKAIAFNLCNEHTMKFFEEERSHYYLHIARLLGAYEIKQVSRIVNQSFKQLTQIKNGFFNKANAGQTFSMQNENFTLSKVFTKPKQYGFHEYEQALAYAENHNLIDNPDIRRLIEDRDPSLSRLKVLDSNYSYCKTTASCLQLCSDLDWIKEIIPNTPAQILFPNVNISETLKNFEAQELKLKIKFI